MLPKLSKIFFQPLWLVVYSSLLASHYIDILIRNHLLAGICVFVHQCKITGGLLWNLGDDVMASGVVIHRDNGIFHANIQRMNIGTNVHVQACFFTGDW